MKEHYRSPDDRNRTMCGLLLSNPLITLTDNREHEAACMRCHASDMRRMMEDYREEQAALPPKERDDYEG